MEGISACLSSGTASAYLYALYGESDYLPKAAHAANLGTAGFLLSTAAYALLYRYFGLTGLLSATVLAGAAGDRVPFASSLLTALGIGWRFAGFPVQGWDSSYPSREKPSSTCVMLMGLPAGRKA